MIEPEKVKRNHEKTCESELTMLRWLVAMERT